MRACGGVHTNAADHALHERGARGLEELPPDVDAPADVTVAHDFIRQSLSIQFFN